MDLLVRAGVCAGRRPLVAGRAFGAPLSTPVAQHLAAYGISLDHGDQERERVPIARDAERPMSTARRRVAGRSQA
jgi:hypothetical protein